MSSFRANVWDPTLIVGQMLAMQSLFYSCESVLMILWSFVTSYRPLIDHVFAAQTMRPMTIVQLLSSVGCAWALSHVVQRAKQCLDFACTLHVFHVLIVAVYNHTIPTSFTWWLLQVVSTVVCTVLGEYLCMRRDTLEIPLSVPKPIQRTESSNA